MEGDKKVKKVKKVKDLKASDLKLSPEAFDVLKGYTVDSLVLMARREDLFGALMKARGYYIGIDSDISNKLAKEATLCKKASDEFMSALEQGGFFRTDFDEYKIDFNIMTFLRVILNDCRFTDDYFNSFFNTRREWKTFTNEEYEEFDGLTKQQIEGFMLILHSVLSEREYLVICLRMGLVDGTCFSRKTVAESFGMTGQEVFIMERDIFKRMSHTINREVLENMYQNFLVRKTSGLVKKTQAQC